MPSSIDGLIVADLGAVAAPSWRSRADVCRINERSSSPWALRCPRHQATTRPYGDADVWLVLRTLAGASATGPCSSVRFSTGSQRSFGPGGFVGAYRRHGSFRVVVSVARDHEQLRCITEDRLS